MSLVCSYMVGFLKFGHNYAACACVSIHKVSYVIASYIASALTIAIY